MSQDRNPWAPREHRLERDSELQRRVQERRFFEYAKGWWQQYRRALSLTLYP